MSERALIRAEEPFAGRHALIFGGAKGIGGAVAREFAQRGARVVIADIDQEASAETASAIAAAGGQALTLACDVTSHASMMAAVTDAERHFGEIDIVMNNVGVLLSGNPEDIPFDEWQRIFDLNLFPVVRSNEIFLPRMLARGRGHIVNTASFAGLYPYAVNRLPYASSKAALIALSESLALYLLPRGIKVSCFCPGPVMTGVMQGMKSWSENTVMSGPGQQFALITAEQSAVILADGMRDGRILIPTDEKVWEVMAHHGVSPDQFIRDRLEAFAQGDMGLPVR